MLKEQLTTKGFSIIEIILAFALVGLFASIFVGALVASGEGSRVAGNRARAGFLAEEGLEAVRSIRDGQFAALHDGTYGLIRSAGAWQLTPGSDFVDIFRREIEVTTITESARQVTITVSWQQSSQRSGSASARTVLTHWRIGDWRISNGLAGLGFAGTQDGRRIQTQGDYAYIIRAGGDPDFAVVNISDPAAPVTVFSTNVPGVPSNIALSSNFAYITSTDNAAELLIVNISNPAAPTMSPFDITVAPAGTDALSLYAVGQMVYLARVASTGPEFFVIDASIPAIVGAAVELGTNASELFAAGNFAYAASVANSAELQVINLSSRSRTDFDLAGNADGLSIAGSGNLLALGRASGAVHLFDIGSNPAVPATLGGWNAGGAVNDLALGNGGTYLFMGTSNAAGEFQVIDVINPLSPQAISSLNLPAVVNGVAYNQPLDRVFIATALDAAEFGVIAPAP